MRFTKKMIVAAMVVASQGAMAAAQDTASATANWQGVVPGVIQSSAFVITGKNGDLVTPIGQLMRSQDGSIVAPVIQLEARDNTGTLAAPAAGELISDTTRDDGNGGSEGRSVSWEVTDVAFFANGAPITGVEWSIKHDGEELATYDSTGVTKVKAHTDDILLLNAESTSPTEKIDKYAGKNAALSVTVVATEL